MNPKATAYSMSILLLLGAACEGVRLPEELGDPGQRPVERAAKAPPIVGGTMLVTRDGAFAVVSDPPRDSIHIVDLREWKETGTLALEDGALPFRAVEDIHGQVHITLRGTGELVTVDPASASITDTSDVCPNPRGVAFDEASGSRYVACAGGMLVTLPGSGEPPTRRYIAPDLRDVYVSEGRLFVTRFRAAEVIEVEDGGWSLAGAPESLVNSSSSREPTTAWRTLPRPGGGWVMLHQSASTDPVPGFTEPGIVVEDSPADGGGYAGGGGGEAGPCAAAVVNTTLSAAGDDGIVRNAGLFLRIALAVDAAVSPDGLRVAISTPTQQDIPQEDAHVSVFEVQLSGLSTHAHALCHLPQPVAFDLHDDIVSVAYQPDGALLAQSRDTPTLYRIQDGATEQLELAGSDVSDTGFELFHNDAGGGISCASCHPEGGEDGRTWVFEDIGPRRTQALNVGLEGTAPFHWAGDMSDIHMIARRVRQGAMGGTAQSEEREAALRDWMFALRPPSPLRPQSDASAARGQQLFGSLGCASCHAGPSFTSAASSDLGRGLLQTPALRGVALRSPYMHDGRSRTLEEAVIDMVDTTAATTELDGEQIASLVAYLETL